MNSYSSKIRFMDEMAQNLGINRMPSEKEEMYYLRVIYSASALMGLAACNDIEDEDDTPPATVPIVHVNKRIHDEFEGLCKIYSIDDINYDEFIQEIVCIYRKTGFYYHKDKRVKKSKRRSSNINNIELIRSPLLSEKFFMSGSGYYRANSIPDNELKLQGIESFGLENYHLEDIYQYLFDDVHWDSLSDYNDFEFLNSKKVWSNKIPENEKFFFGRRMNQSVKIYYLFRQNEEKEDEIFISEISEALQKNIRLAFFSYWYHEGQTPKIIYKHFSDYVYVRTERVLPKNEDAFFRLMSWPVIFRESKNKSFKINRYYRIMNKSVFGAFQVILESKGYQFEEEKNE